MLKLDTHQELFDRWYEMESSQVWERSTSISKDLGLVWVAARAYAQKHGLKFTNTEDAPDGT